MRIAVPVNANGTIDGHFGHCAFYNVYEIEQYQARFLKRIDAVNGCGCKSGIASVLAGEGIRHMLAGGIGQGAVNVLNAHGIDVTRGCSGDALEIARMYARGDVTDSGSNCSHHDHHHADGHSGGHGCNH